MVEKEKVKNQKLIREIVSEYQEGEKLQEEGYGDLGFTIMQNAINKALELGKNARKRIADIILPNK